MCMKRFNCSEPAVRNLKRCSSQSQLWILGFGIFLGFGFWDLGFYSTAVAAERTVAATNDTFAATNRVDAVEQRRGRFAGPERGVYKAQINAHWFQNNTRFWYRNDLRDGAKEFVVVDAEKGIRRPAFDHQKLAAVLSKVAGEQFSPVKLPFSEIDFVNDGKTLQFETGGKTWSCDLQSYDCKPVDKSAELKPAGSASLYASQSSSGQEGRGEEALFSEAAADAF